MSEAPEAIAAMTGRKRYLWLLSVVLFAATQGVSALRRPRHLGGRALTSGELLLTSSTISNISNNPLLIPRGGADSPPASVSKKKKKKSKKKSRPESVTSSSDTLSSSKRDKGSTTQSNSREGTKTTTTKHKKKTKKSTITEDESNGDTNIEGRTKDGKDAIKQAMEKDPAEALGDAIRSRSEELRKENPLLNRIDQSIYSVGWALGASDQREDMYVLMGETEAAAAADGGVAGSPSSVLVSYFLKSHGGAHALQCLCSVLASSAGLAALMVPSKNVGVRRVLLQRALMFAMTKHVAGLLGAAVLAAKAIPQVGLRKARVWMEQLAVDPVSQYLFYAACILLWLPSNTKQSMIIGGDKPWLTLLLLGPILLREVVSTMLVISDVLVLWTTSSEGEDGSAELIQTILQSSQDAINIVMSLLVSPKRWRSADPAERQQILAKLASKASLSLEVITGVIIALDAVGRSGQYVFGTGKPSFFFVIKRLILTRIYLQFLWTRKRKISKLATEVRGGVKYVPFYVLDVMLDPRGAMGLPKTKAQQHVKQQQQRQQSLRDFTWKDYAKVALGLDE